MPPKRVVIIANGDLRDLAFYRGLLKADDLIFCVNGGTRHALDLGLKPDVIIGDLDSLDPDDRQKLKEFSPQLIEHPPEKEKSDLELALDHAVGMQPKGILIIGALGGRRTDHAFINLLLLYLPLRDSIPACIIDERQEILMAEKEVVVKGAVGDYISLFTLTAESRGIITEGLKYPLKDETLHLASTRGLSNELTAPRAKIRIQSGLLLIIKTSVSVKPGSDLPVH